MAKQDYFYVRLFVRLRIKVVKDFFFEKIEFEV